MDEKKFRKEIVEALEGHRRNFKHALLILDSARKSLEPTYKKKLDKIFANIFLCLDDLDLCQSLQDQIRKCFSKDMSLDASPVANADWMSIPVSICADQITKSAAMSLRDSGLEHLNVSSNAKLRKIAVKQLCDIPTLKSLNCTYCPLLLYPPREIIDKGDYFLMKHLRMVESQQSLLWFFR
mmetsp:Transcript_23424/g.52627  ORF Transcript_23424/g.52627 Transcript_23424/m.52627 type:complete len:182 (-) Transcript_23424:37-582(-)